MEENKKYIQSVERAFTILEYVADNGPVRLNQISEHLGLKVTTVFGLLQTMEHAGYIVRQRQGLEYGLGINTLKLGLSFDRDPAFKKIIHTLLCELVQAIDETAYFEIQIGERYYYYDVVLSAQPLKVVPDEKNFIALPRASAVVKVYEGYRQGMTYARDLQEVTEGLNCFAVPFKSGERIIGCVALSGPAFRFTEAQMERAYAAYVNIMKRHNLEKYL